MTIAEQLERRVGDVVRRVISELPQDLRELAERVPVFCEWEMADHWLDEGVADDSMGRIFALSKYTHSRRWFRGTDGFLDENGDIKFAIVVNRRCWANEVRQAYFVIEAGRTYRPWGYTEIGVRK